jgi:RNA polymerase sigma factor (sigma-70 family)
MTERHKIENRIDLKEAIRLLPDRLRLTVVMYAVGMTQREIGEELGVNQSTVQRRLENAFSLMKNASKQGSCETG